jgi:hypothetical protein
MTPWRNDDQRLLLEALEDLYGKQIVVYEGVVYFRGWRLNLDKLEADYQQWRAET